MRSVLTALCLFASTAHAVPAQFTHQGRLLDADGVPLEDEATIIFRVTNDEMGGDELWEETITVPLTNGFYSAVLGADEDNPLDTDVLSQAPVWLELQLDGEPAMFPRSPINAVPYATMATVAEEVSGGPVDASQIAVDGTPVVNELGEWVGPAPTVSWSDIEGMPEDFADGIDDDTDTDTDSFAALGTSCLDGDIPVWDSVLVEWVCGLDAVLTADEVDTIVADNGYAMESEVFSSSFLDLTDVPDGLDDGDDNTQLSESEVDSMVADNGYAMATDAFSGSFSDLSGVPEGLMDGDTTLGESEVDAMVADNGYAMSSEVFSGSFLDLSDVPEGLTDGDHDALADLIGLCSDGESVTYDAETEAFECRAAGSDGAISSGFTDVLSSESITISTSTGEPATVIAALVASSDGYVRTVQSSAYTECSDCGTGSDGSWVAPPGTTSASISTGTHNFTDFHLPAGATLTASGDGPVIIYVTGTAQIDGIIDIRGQDGRYYTSGSWAGGAGGPGGTAGTSARDGGQPGIHDASWSTRHKTDVDEITGGGGGEGNDNSGTVRCGGGGGGGALAMVAARIIVSGSILADGGKPGCYLGGSGYAYIPCAGGGAGGGIWLRASEVDVSGTVRADAGLQRTHCTSTPDDGVARIDARKLSDPDQDAHLAGVLDGIPPAEHLYQSALGVVTFTNNGIATVNVDLRASD